MENKNDLKLLISRILAADEQARAATASAAQKSANADALIAQRVEQVRADYLSRAMRRVESIRIAESECAQDEWSDIEKRHAEIAARLNALYEENGDAWVDEIVRRTIGG